MTGRINTPQQASAIMMKSAELEKMLGIKEIKWPYLAFPAGYEFMPMFPFTGAAARFCVRKTGSKEYVSVYLDTREVLGYFGGRPYWEAYPIGENNERYELEDTKGLIAAIVSQLKKKPRKKK